MKLRSLFLTLTAMLLTVIVSVVSMGFSPQAGDQCVDIPGTSGPLHDVHAHCYGSGDICCYVPGTSDAYRYY